MRNKLNSFKILINKYKYFTVILFLGTFSWIPVMVKSGITYPFGVGFWGPNGHDGVWHIALIKSLAGGSWELPIFTGETIKNYHVGFDLFVAIIHKISFIPVSILYFQIIPLLFSLLIGILSYKFVYLWKKSKAQAFWSVFFVYFGGSFGWIVNYIRNGNFDGESMFWSQQSISTLINPPYALSLIVIFSGLIFLMEGLKKNDKRKSFIASLLFGVLIIIKVYGGILILTGLFFSGIFEVIKHRNFYILKIFSGSLILSVILFLSLVNNPSGNIVFQPFWFLETMMGLSDRFNWPKYYEAMINYRLGGVYHKFIIFYLSAFALFLMGNMGTRIIGIYYFIKKIKRFDFMDIILVTILGVGIIIPIIFLQNGTPWNTIQFFYYSLVVMGIFAGITLGEFYEKNKSVFTILTFLFIILITLPTTCATLSHHYLPSRPPAIIPSDEIEALNFLSNLKSGVVLTYPFDKNLADNASANPPRPLYLYESTAYVSAYGSKPVFLEDEINLNITGYDWVTRKKSIKEFYLSLDQEFVFDFLRINKIKYIYWVNDQRAKLSESQLGIELIFEKDKVRIYRVIPLRRRPTESDSGG